MLSWQQHAQRLDGDFTFPVEVERRSFVGPSAQMFFKTMGIRGARLNRAFREITDDAEKGSF